MEYICVKDEYDRYGYVKFICGKSYELFYCKGLNRHYIVCELGFREYNYYKFEEYFKSHIKFRKEKIEKIIGNV